MVVGLQTGLDDSFEYKWLHVEDERQTEFNRVVYRFACTPGAVGAAGSTASPNDPVFWVSRAMTHHDTP